ncbi:MAG: 30S ribosomal protein S18 [Candidatus Omnitrophota bacterium]|nr:30S ribosomal protein S18 [Candidatus Omnitrophota bacterium]RKY31248.1 MAG: 30S ribosomal protein S18 [Candidatus Omnitrophota bacterium]RKY44748.1 MAG: 30S ribosomal protein S18 [Candidatus Omnitrophota bacterium]HDN86445.1 30S ribosomal protein S18 [Candidatus Omnitrophota bacterium]
MAKRKVKQVRFKKSCIFCKKNLEIDYKNVELLSRYLSSKGKIVSRRFSGNCAKHQRKIAREIKRARFLSLLPYLRR